MEEAYVEMEREKDIITENSHVRLLAPSHMGALFVDDVTLAKR